MGKSVNFKWLFFGTVTLYCFFFARFGFENFDTGYIASYSWRILKGEVPYVDFFYKGPPLTLYFHSLFFGALPEYGQFYFVRIIFYVLFALQVFFAVSGFYTLYDSVRADRWLVMTAGFILSILNFSPYPWPTTDGLLFASAAFFLISKNVNGAGYFRLCCVALLCILSALTKQSFYTVPLLFALWMLLSMRFRKAIAFVGFLCVFSGVFYVIADYLWDWENYVRQTSTETHLFDLFYTGLHHYLPIPIRILVPTAVILFSAVCYIRWNKKLQLIPHWTVITKWIAISMMIAVLFLSVSGMAQIASRIAFDVATLFTIMSLLLKEHWRKELPKLMMLGLAWSCSISLGYPYPALFTTGILLVLLSEMTHFGSMLKYPMIAWVSIGFLYAFFPYREKPLWHLDTRLDNVSPKIAYLYTSERNAEKFRELRSLREKYGAHYVVAPNIPMAHYLFGDRSVVPSDWLIETEIGRNPDLFKQQIPKSGSLVFLEKSYLDSTDEFIGSPETFSQVSWYLYQNMKPIGETRHFVILNGSK